MKLHFLLPIIVLISCKSTPKQVEVVNSETESKWDLKTRTVYSNNLNSEGQPDTGFVTKYVYDNSNISDISKMQIIRRYRNNKLYSQKQFDISENGNYILTAENFRTYDFKGRPDSVILIKKGMLALKEKYKYDNEDRELQIISISNGSTDDEDDTKAASTTSYDSMKTDFVYDP
ncbi:MAG TPA: hypothetical protein VFQ58_02910, partial [Flavisolibacter sp.]|nr:hypothetical protein [Flavisolibacter sp.]